MDNTREVVDDRLRKALADAGRSALGMPGSLESFYEFMRRAQLKVVPAEAAIAMVTWEPKS